MLYNSIRTKQSETLLFMWLYYVPYSEAIKFVIWSELKNSWWFCVIWFIIVECVYVSNHKVIYYFTMEYTVWVHLSCIVTVNLLGCVNQGWIAWVAIPSVGSSNSLLDLLHKNPVQNFIRKRWMHVQITVTEQHAATSLGKMQCDHNKSYTTDLCTQR